MNHCVPDFDVDDDFSIPSSSVAARPKKSTVVEDDVMELLWENGQVILHNQNQRSQKKNTHSKQDDAPADHSASRQINQHQQHLFMQEDEMASWLHYPLNFDSDFCADLLYPPAPCVTSTTLIPTTNNNNNNNNSPTHIAASRPPIPPHRRIENVMQSSRAQTAVRELTVVDSNETPTMPLESRFSEARRSTEGAYGGNNKRTMNGGGGTSGERIKDSATCEMTVTSSPGGSSASADPAPKPPPEDRKRKGREPEDDCHSEDVELESADVKKQTGGSSSTKRARAAEVHNLSERRRRDRINEKMKALQELIPRCNKSDKASMLDEAIEYLKSLQLQVQMMSMGCGLVPMMFPGIQQFIPNMGLGMNMGMGMEMGINRPMMPFPNILAGSTLPTPTAAAHLGPRFPMPAYMHPVPPPDPSRVQANNQPDPTLNSLGMQNPNQPRMPNFVDTYQQYLNLHQMQIPVVQNQPSSSKPSSSKGNENLENHP